MALYGLHYAGFGAVVGHIGFDKIAVTDRAGLDTHAYTHYLHHKYFEVNYGDGLMPLDKLFGSWHADRRRRHAGAVQAQGRPHKSRGLKRFAFNLNQIESKPRQARRRVCCVLHSIR